MGTINLPIPWVDYHRGGHPWAFSYMQPDPCPFCGMTRDEQQLADEVRQTDFYQGTQRGTRRTAQQEARGVHGSH
jgi:hypothetical protein